MKLRFTFIMSVLSILLSSVCIFTMSFFVSQEAQIGRNIVAVLFYVFALLGYLLLFVTNKERKSEVKFDVSKKDKIKKWFMFFSNKYACVADVFFIVCLIGTIAVAVTAEKANIIHFVIISLFFFFANAHFMLNGENFKYIFKIRQRKKEG